MDFSIIVSSDIDEFFKIRHPYASRPTDVHRGQMS